MKPPDETTGREPGPGRSAPASAGPVGRFELWLALPSRQVAVALSAAALVALLSAQLYLNWRSRGFEVGFSTLLAAEGVEWGLWALFVPVIVALDRRLEAGRAKSRLRMGEGGGPASGARHLPPRPGVTPSGAARSPGPADDHLVLREGGRLLRIPHAAITWIEASGVYCRIHTAEGRPHLVRCPLKGLARRLGGHGFHRIHRSSIVNLERVREVQPLSHGDGLVLLAHGTKLRLSSSRREGFERTFLGRAEGGGGSPGA